ncbi:MAG: LysM peptidoglycan-binding domain-containing protein [Luteolibacter sp.]
MKPTLLFATLSMVFASPSLSAKSEVEILRAKCAEQERQIQQLEQDNSKLRSGISTTRTAAAAQSEVAEKSAQPSRPEDSANPGVTPGSTNYIVKAGDSIEKIARKVSTSPETLAKANGLKTNSLIHPGQKLKVPNSAAVASLKESAAPAKTSEVATPTPGKSYTIRDNDTFSSISRKQKVSVASLIAANPKVKPTSLRTGQVINLAKGSPAPEAVAKAPAPEPAKQSVAAKSPAPTSSIPVIASKAPAPAVEKTHTPAPAPFAKTSEPKPAAPTPPAVAKSEPAAPQAAETASSSEKKIHPITIDGEMTYEEFAAKHGTNPERLNALNGLDLSNATVLAKGSELYVPAQP